LQNLPWFKGAAKEAKLLIEWLRQDPKGPRPDVAMCTNIRQEACDILRDMCHEAFGSKGNSSVGSNDEEEKTKRYDLQKSIFKILDRVCISILYVLE
jgi:hypothetical protein